MKNFDASLELSPEKARELGYSLVEHLLEYQARLATLPVVKVESRAVVAFRYVPQGHAANSVEGARRIDALNRAIAVRMQEQGFALVLTTELRGKTVLRLCTINPRTTEEDIAKNVGRTCQE